MIPHLVHVDPEKQEKIRESDSVDCTDALELVNARRCACLFNLSEPRMGNGKLIIAPGFRDPLALSVTSRVVIPRRERKSLNCSPGTGRDIYHQMLAENGAILKPFTHPVNYSPFRGFKRLQSRITHRL